MNFIKRTLKSIKEFLKCMSMIPDKINSYTMSILIVSPYIMGIIVDGAYYSHSVTNKFDMVFDADNRDIVCLNIPSFRILIRNYFECRSRNIISINKKLYTISKVHVSMVPHKSICGLITISKRYTVEFKSC